MTTATEIQLKLTARETAEIIVGAIEDWMQSKGSVKVYITTEGNIETSRVDYPSDHAYDLTTISEWNFGDRDDYDAELTSEEREGLIEMFLTDWKVQETYNPEGDEVWVFYA